MLIPRVLRINKDVVKPAIMPFIEKATQAPSKPHAYVKPKDRAIENSIITIVRNKF